MTIDEYLDIGKTITLGSYHFSAEAIKDFAHKYDPQPFHIDEDAAKTSMFGNLCASGWHTTAVWMKLNLINRDHVWDGPGSKPEFGPSPGFKNLKWLKPVFAGETITFTRRNLDHRPIASRPGWRILTLHSEGVDSTGDKVLEFDSAVLVEVG